MSFLSPPQVAQLNKTIECMQGEFAEMLKETLDKMYEKLDNTQTTPEGQSVY
jgi:hypothetical protein